MNHVERETTNPDVSEIEFRLRRLDERFEALLKRMAGLSLDTHHVRDIITNLTTSVHGWHDMVSEGRHFPNASENLPQVQTNLKNAEQYLATLESDDELLKLESFPDNLGLNEPVVGHHLNYAADFIKKHGKNEN